MNASQGTLPEVLLVDDDDESLFLIKKLLDTAKVQNPVRAFHDGEDAISYLKSICRSASSKLAGVSLMLLDVKMPRLSGFDVLAWIKQQPLLKHLTIVMLSTSDDTKDMERAQALGAHTYLIKFPTAQALSALVRLADDAAREVPNEHRTSALG